MKTKQSAHAPTYMMELIEYAGKMVPRGFVYQMLLDAARSQGHPKTAWRYLADRWMQGYELRLKINAEGKPSDS